MTSDGMGIPAQPRFITLEKQPAVEPDLPQMADFQLRDFHTDLLRFYISVGLIGSFVADKLLVIKR